MVPTMMPSKWNLRRFLSESEDEIKKVLRSDEFEAVKELISVANQNDLLSETIQQAKIIEGSMRNTGIHACGVIITPDDITNFVPVQTAKDSTLYVTQFDNSVAESAGLLKMDFLGLKTLTLIKDTIAIIKQRTGVEIDPEAIPIDDVKTYELFQRGETVGVFQYESPGMQKYMRELKPTVFADLIAMNALYRPGPLEYIPSFIRRKNGEEPITYDLEACEEYLKETYGHTVYQEQVMLLSQKLANFTKGEADQLRKAMGKKMKDVLDEMKPKFIEGGKANGHPVDKLEKIWHDWEAFASYAFNKSHSTCYALIAFHTGYLKAHYPAEFMAAVLSNNMKNIKDITFFMEECRSIGIPVLGPDVNESSYSFSVNDEGAIRFGMGAIKGVGSNAVETIIKERNENGKFESIFEFVQRVDLQQVNKRTLENLALAGAFDAFEIHRAQFLYEEDGTTNLEKLIRYGSAFQISENNAQASLFGDMTEEIEIVRPHLPNCQPWSSIQKLNREKEVVGIYISAHPLDEFKDELKFFRSINLKQLKENERQLIDKEFNVAGIITDVQHRISNRDGREFGIMTLEDYVDSYEFTLFGEDYLRFKHLLQVNMMVGIRLKVTERIWKDKEGRVTGGKVYVNIIRMQLLSDVLDDMAKKIVISLDIAYLADALVSDLVQILMKHEGEKKLSVIVKDKSTKTKLGMTSHKAKVDINKELLKELRSISHLKVNLN